jgi:hypothetical protein
LVVSLQLNNKEHLLKALADSGASSSIILEAYTSRNLIKRDKSNQTTWSTIGGQFTADKSGLVTYSLCGYSQIPEVDFQERYVQVINDVTFRILLVTILTWNLSGKGIGIETAFLHGNLKETIFMEIP